MRYVIVGAGAVGGTLAARVAGEGHEVVLVARGSHREALASEGLRFHSPSGTDVFRLPVVASADELQLRRDDVLVLATKTQDTAGALRMWAAAPVHGGQTAAEDLPVLCAQNGVENERLAARSFATVLGACVWLPAAHLDPGEVAAWGAPLSGILHIGCYPRGLSDVAEQVAAELSGPHLGVRARDDVMRWKYGKLLANLGNAIDALCSTDSDTTDLRAAVAAEGRAVLDACRIARTSPDEERADRGDALAQQPPPGWSRGGGSTWQSLVRGSETTEVEYLNGEVVLMGRQAGVPTPVNAALVAAMATQLRAGGGARTVDPDRLRALAGLVARADHDPDGRPDTDST